MLAVVLTRDTRRHDNVTSQTRDEPLGLYIDQHCLLSTSRRSDTKITIT